MPGHHCALFVLFACMGHLRFSNVPLFVTTCYSLHCRAAWAAALRGFSQERLGPPRNTVAFIYFLWVQAFVRAHLLCIHEPLFFT